MVLIMHELGSGHASLRRVSAHFTVAVYGLAGALPRAVRRVMVARLRVGHALEGEVGRRQGIAKVARHRDTSRAEFVEVLISNLHETRYQLHRKQAVRHEE